MSPNYERDPQLQELAKFAASKGLIVKVYKKLNKLEMAAFVKYMDKCALEKIRSITFTDDPVGLGVFTTSVNSASSYNEFVTGSKHYLTDIVFSTQAVGAMSSSARKNIDVFIFMPDMISRMELWKACPIVNNFDDFCALMDRYAEKSYCALWINVQFGKKGVYWVNANGDISPITSVPN